jgi:peroxiredoxin
MPCCYTRFYAGAKFGLLVAILLCALGAVICPVSLLGQKQQIVWSDQEKPILQQMRGLRGLPDDVRVGTTKQLALQIRQLPKTTNKLRLASGLSNLATEGDFGRDTLQEVTTTLADALKEQPVPADKGGPAEEYIELAKLVRYERMQASSDSPQFAAAMARLEAEDKGRAEADFSLTDLQGKSWRLKQLQGKVVLVNFWATWCPPCRKEMPDLQTLYDRFKNQGLVVLAISDEDVSEVRPFITERNVTYPILLDPGRKVNEMFRMDGIPKSFVYDRSGKLVAQSIDMRTQKQFLEMLEQAGLH